METNDNILKTKPYDYQLQAIYTAHDNLIKTGYAAFFAEMGTGKTLMSLYTIIRLHEAGKIASAVLVCPKTLTGTWRAEIEKHINIKSGGLKILVWDSVKSKTEKWKREFLLFNKARIKIFIANIESFQQRNKYLESLITGIGRAGDSIILTDESSKIKSPTANRTKNLIKLSALFSYRVILTGTEITNTILDLYTQFEFLKNNFWATKNYFTFRARYAVLEDEYAAGGRTFKKVVGFQRINELMQKVSPHIIRLRKEDCLDLPEKIYQTIEFEMPKEMRRVYDELKSDLHTEYKGSELKVIQKIAMFTRFRQICGGFFPGETKTDLTGEAILTEKAGRYISENPKLDYILDEAGDTEQKTIIWCSFVDEIKKVHHEISNQKEILHSNYYHGGLSQDERVRELDLFKSEQGKFLVINPQTGAYGLNLQFCSLAYYYTLPLSPEQYWQSQDRIHRIGQKNHPVYKIMIYKNSIEERIFKLLDQKKTIADSFAEMSLSDVFDFI